MRVDEVFWLVQNYSRYFSKDMHLCFIRTLINDAKEARFLNESLSLITYN